MWPWRSPWPLGSRARSMHILSLLFDLSIHTSVNSWLSHFNFQLLLKKGTSGWSDITSSIYLNWNISVIYCWFEIKHILVKAEWRWLLFRKKKNSTSLPVSHTWRHQTFNCGYLSYFWSDCITIWSETSGWSIWLWGHIKYHVTLKVTLTFGFNGKVNAYSFFYCLICQFITPQILDWVTSSFQLWSLRKGTSGWQGIWWSIYLNWNISFIYFRFEIKLILVKAEWWWLFSL